MNCRSSCEKLCLDSLDTESQARRRQSLSKLRYPDLESVRLDRDTMYAKEMEQALGELGSVNPCLAISENGS